jgi:predicted alpha/beta-hydrolase family hydrolase
MREYEKEKANVEAVIHQMISEDIDMMKLTRAKQDQSKRDMISSLMEKKANLDRLREID